MENVYRTGSLIDTNRFQDGELGKAYGNTIGERNVEDNMGNLKAMADYMGTTEGEGQFTVTYASATMIAASGLPFTPSDENIAYVARVPASGAMEVYTKRNNDIRYWTNTFQVTSASFVATDHFIVGLYGKKPALDEATDAYKVAQLNPTPMDFTEYQTLTGSVLLPLTGSWFSGSIYANCKGKVTARLWVEYGYGNNVTDAGANTLYMKLLHTKDVSDTTEQWDEPQLSVTAGVTDIQQNLYTFTPKGWTNVSGAVSAHTKYTTYFDIDVNGSEGFKMALSESIGTSNTTGVLDLYYTMTDK